MKQDREKKLWFRAKRYGYGWYPHAWQGWLVVFVWLLLFTGIVSWLNLKFANIWVAVTLSLLAGGFLTGVLYAIALKTGEKPRWKWGENKEDPE